MSISLTTTRTISQSATSYRILATSLSFYQDGATLAKCAIAVVGVLGNDVDGEFVRIPGPSGEFSALIRDDEAMAWLSSPVVQGDVSAPRIEAFIAWLDAKLKEKGVV